MNKIKNNLRTAFTVAPNDLINNRGIDARARFIYVYMASKPNNWEFNNTDLKNACGIKDPSTIRKLMQELVNSGWVSRSAQNRVASTFSYYNYSINPSPVGVLSTTVDITPVGVLSATEKNRYGKNPQHSNKEYLTKKELLIKKEDMQNFKKEDSIKKPELKKEKTIAAQKRKRPELILVKIFMANYAKENNLKIDPVAQAASFYDYYTSNGWKVGRNVMKDWQATARNWIRRANDGAAFQRVVKADERRFKGMDKEGIAKATSEGFNVVEF